MHRLHGMRLALQLERGAALEDFLRGALADDAVASPSGVLTTTDMILREKSKGISSTLLYSGMASCPFSSREVEDGAVEQVLQAGLEVAVEVGEHQHALVALPAPRRNAAPG